MGCAPHPRKNENIPKTNAEPNRLDTTNFDKQNRGEQYRMTKVRFEDLANNDFAIKEERRENVKVEKMDFVNKVQVS